MLYIFQFYAEQHTGARYESPLRVSRSFRVMEKPDALHKINDFIYKDTEYKYFGCLNMSSELFTFCFGAGYEGSRSIFRL